MPPRKKILATEQTEPGVSLARRRPAVKAAETANVSAPPPRARIFSAEEKRQMILAHAAMRHPVDRTQALSLWIGVIVCALAIGIGWIYSVRQSIANTFTDSNVNITSPQDAQAALHDNLQSIMSQLDNLEQQNAARVQTRWAIAQELQRTSSSSVPATSSIESKAVHPNLFRPAVSSTPQDQTNTVNLPQGVKADTP